MREIELNDTGGAIEQDVVAVLVVRDGLVWRVDHFDIGDVDAAVARFEKLTDR